MVAELDDAWMHHSISQFIYSIGLDLFINHLGYDRIGVVSDWVGQPTAAYLTWERGFI